MMVIGMENLRKRLHASADRSYLINQSINPHVSNFKLGTQNLGTEVPGSWEKMLTPDPRVLTVKEDWIGLALQLADDYQVVRNLVCIVC